MNKLCQLIVLHLCVIIGMSAVANAAGNSEPAATDFDGYMAKLKTCYYNRVHHCLIELSDEALSTIENLSDNQKATLHYLKAVAYQLQEKWPEAYAEVEDWDLVGRDLVFPDSKMQSNVILYFAGKMKRAIASADVLIENPDTRALGLLFKANVLITCSHFDEALETINTLIDENPDAYFGHGLMGHYKCTRSFDYEGAIEEYKIAETTLEKMHDKQQRYPIYAALAMSYANLRDKENFLKYMEKALTIKMGRSRIANIHNHSLMIIRKSLETEGRFPTYEETLEKAEFFFNNNDYRKAAEYYTVLVVVYNCTDDEQYKLALCHDKLGNPGSAIYSYSLYLDRNPDAKNKKEVLARLAEIDN